MGPSRGILKILSAGFYLCILLSGAGGLFLAGFFLTTVKDLPRVPEPLSRIIETPPTEILAATGERIMVLGGRQAVPLSAVSPHFIRAVTATEDHRFWEHHGVDKIRTLKALYITLFVPGEIQGASTITQQLSKNLFFTFERTFKRKFLELLTAVQIESRYGKREILQAYLNQITFGAGASGIEQAARTFFGKSAASLDLAESALLAGLPKSPSRYNPYSSPERAIKRRKVVLERMVAVGHVTAGEAEQAWKSPLGLLREKGGANTGSYYLDAVVKKLEERYGPEVVHRGGLKVITTLDPFLQNRAREAVAAGLAELDRRIGVKGEEGQTPQGALISIETNSGAVKAMVGGRDYTRSEFNRALSANRQPGSCFKPILYYTAFEKLGLSPAASFVDRRVTLSVAGADDWTPANFSPVFKGPMILKNALGASVNTVAAQLVSRTGPLAVIETAEKFGIRSPLANVLSVALGSSPVSPREMASAFATLAAGGIYHEPFMIRRVEDALGRVLEEKIVNGRRTLDPNIAFQVVDMMKGVVDRGSGAVIRTMGFSLSAAGKTGTTNDFNDAWFTGFTPNLSTSVWVGYDRGKPLRTAKGRGITGGLGAAPIWGRFMVGATDGEPDREFAIPGGIRFEWVDPATGCPVGETAEGVVRVALIKGRKPCLEKTEEGGAAGVDPGDQGRRGAAAESRNIDEGDEELSGSAFKSRNIDDGDEELSGAAFKSRNIHPGEG